MRHYIAYNKVEDWGPVREGGSTFAHWSGKARSFLDKTRGETVWVISGERVGGEMVYKLCHFFNPDRIRTSGKGYTVSGLGTGFAPHVEVTREHWMADLLKEQNHFSHGLSEIRNKNIIDALTRLTADAPTENSYPDEVAHPDRYIEGAVRRVVVNAYERDPNARAACLAHYGTICVVCCFDFEAQYGPAGKGVIHVHHLKPLSKIRESYHIDPIKDLRPVCPNCHTIIHKAKAHLSIGQARALVRSKFGEC